ncbi:MAG: M1 family aminopeptidase [Flavobacteriaceae bacterium]
MKTKVLNSPLSRNGINGFCTFVYDIFDMSFKNLLTVLLLFWVHIGVAQQDTVVDFLTLKATVKPIAAEEKVTGTVQVTFRMLKDADSVYLDAHHMRLLDQALEGVPVKASEDKIWFLQSFSQGQTYTAFFTYEATPSQALYFTNGQIWTQGQGKYTSHWLPSLDDMNDKIEFDLTIEAPNTQTVVANGALEKFIIYDEDILWQYDMKNPMSSYLVAFAMGDFKMKQTTSATGIPIEMYLASKDTLYREPTYRYTKAIFDFLETEIGVAYPWQNYKQVPVRDFLYAGMENTGCTLFSEAFVVDSIGFKDRNYVNVNAHELAHQWFGDFVTESSGTHHWLQEGFATYYALLAERELFGEDYFYWKLYNSAEKLKALSDEGKGEKLLNPNASSLTFYEKGAWALHLLRETMGDEAFRKGIQQYLNAHAYGNVTTQDFVQAMQAVSSVDLASWEANWLEQSAFQAEEAYQSLKRSVFMQQYFQLAALRPAPYTEKRSTLIEAIRLGDDYLAQEAVYQLAQEPLFSVSDLYLLALQSPNWVVRQAVALSLETVPPTLQTAYEALLEDDSYLTQEAALYTLWLNFPEKQLDYLNATKAVVGFQDKNVRQLWLALALHTQGYEETEKLQFLDELTRYSSEEYSFEVREIALDYLYSMQVKSDAFVLNLVNACTHHYWRFRDDARSLLDDFMATPANKERVLALFSSYSEKEKAYLKRKLELP